ncbi:MAG: hypothetical protein Q7T48_22035 [Cellvibrio sp.]|uniref:hypothetical protein n=1 Tax=Cellvibrio sp. TaxID=1965322 RepID=UPI0027170781|nr:hypothetical protein [Cellvibrio sp.]
MFHGFPRDALHYQFARLRKDPSAQFRIGRINLIQKLLKREGALFGKHEIVPNRDKNNSETKNGDGLFTSFYFLVNSIAAT